MANTLLSYYKDALKRRGASPKYLNRDFLAVFLAEYKASCAAGRACYEKTMQTKFYNKNSTAYCEFLEIHNEYENGMNRIRAAARA